LPELHPTVLPDDVLEAFAVLEQVEISPEELAELIRCHRQWMDGERGNDAPMLFDRREYIFRGAAVEVIWAWNLMLGDIMRSWPTITGGSTAKELADHVNKVIPNRSNWMQEPTKRERFLRWSRFEAERRLTDLGIPLEFEYQGTIPHQYMAGLLAATVRNTVKELERQLRTEEDLGGSGEDSAAAAWFELGFDVSNLLRETAKGLGDGRTLQERSLDAVARSLGRKKAGKVTGKHQSDAAMQRRRQILKIAKPIRKGNPAITDEELVEAVAGQLKPRLSRASIHEHIRALKRAGDLPPRLSSGVGEA